MQLASHAATLSALLSLDQPPVALAFLDAAPDAPAAPGPMPSACSMWRAAEKQVFYAAAKDHFNCPVGSMVMGFPLPDEVSSELGGLVESMAAADYLAPEEAGKIPTVPRQSDGILYGPLDQFPQQPDVVVMWLTPAQAMLFHEASGGADWTAPRPVLSGRPGCAALPLAVRDSSPRVSLGCAGMRTFTEVADDRMLAVVTGAQLAEFVAALERTAGSNEQMLTYYRGRKESIAQN